MEQEDGLRRSFNDVGSPEGKNYILKLLWTGSRVCGTNTALGLGLV